MSADFLTSNLVEAPRTIADQISMPFRCDPGVEPARARRALEWACRAGRRCDERMSIVSVARNVCACYVPEFGIDYKGCAALVADDKRATTSGVDRASTTSGTRRGRRGCSATPR